MQRVHWCLPEVGEISEEDQKIQTSTCKRNKSWVYNVAIVYNTVLYI